MRDMWSYGAGGEPSPEPAQPIHHRSTCSSRTPPAHREMIEAQESRFKAKECSFRTIFGLFQGHRICTCRKVAERIENHPPLLAQIHPDIHPRLDPLEPRIHDAHQLQRRELPPRQHPEYVTLLRIVDVQSMPPQHPDLEGDLADLLQRIPAEELQRSARLEDRIHPRPPGLEPPDRNLPQPIPGQAAQVQIRINHIEIHGIYRSSEEHGKDE
jgi:hypothetical protein